MRRLVALLAVGAFLLASGFAYAQSGYVRTKVVDIRDGDQIDGILVSPATEGWVGGNLTPAVKTLIRYRYDFTPEMIRSADSL